MAEEEICTRISESVKMAGFLEKKGKMKIVSAWKKYWFVLEERLLLYYRSQIEYINLSPCRGSLNMGLVTTVRPGSSAGPCVIHVITRTQVVQLRAKNRAAQEEWLQALLDSMSLPLFTKTLKTPLIADLHGHRYSMDNIPSHERQRKMDSERGGKYSIEYRKKDLRDSFYGGSLDNAIWSKKFRNVAGPSPYLSKDKVLEKSDNEEDETKSASDTVFLIGDAESSSTPRAKKKSILGDEKDTVQNVNRDNYSALNRARMSLSDNQLNKMGLLQSSDDEKSRVINRQESQFERIKNAMRKTKEKAFRGKTELERKPSSVKKRRHSFLQKVFKRHNRMENDKEVTEVSESDDPLYDTIDSVQELKESLISSNSDTSQERRTVCSKESGENDFDVEASSSSHNDGQRPVFGSKSILPAQAMSELKTKLKSRESLERQEPKKSVENLGPVPDLPPRRICSRPKSPWHDVPMNNTPVDGLESGFRAHQSTVKFHDDPPAICHNQMAASIDGSNFASEEPARKPEDDLNVLLEQLTEITGGSLRKPSQTIANMAEGNSDEETWGKSKADRRYSDPDYDIPRPHKLVNLYLTDDSKEAILQRTEDSSDTSSSFQSIEPDSLESEEKKNSEAANQCMQTIN